MKTMRCGRVTPPLPCRKLTLDAELQNALPPLLSLLDVLPADDPFLRLDPLQRRHRMLDALKRLLLRESQVQPLLLVFEDLHWIDSEMQALLDNLVESLPLAQLLLLVNYRPEYQHGWGSKTYYTQLRLDPLSVSSTDELLVAGDASGAGAGEGVLESSLSCTNEDGQIPARMHPAQASVVGSTACSDADAA